MLERRGLADSHCENGEKSQKRKKGDHFKKRRCWEGKRGTRNCPPSSDAGGRRAKDAIDRSGRAHIVKAEHGDGVRIRGLFVEEREGGVFTALKTAVVLAFLMGSLPSVDGGRCAFTQVRQRLLFLHPVHTVPGARGKPALSVVSNKRKKHTIRDK